MLIMAITVWSTVTHAAHSQTVGVPGMAGAVVPGPSASYVNPSFAYLAVSRNSRARFRMPAGVAALFLLPDRSPLPLLSETPDEESLDRLDLYKSYRQLLYPTQALLNPPSSPSQVDIRLSSSGIAFAYDSQSAELRLPARHPSGLVAPGTAFLPVPFIAIRARRGVLSTRTGIYIGATGLSVEKSPDLESLVDAGGATSAGTELSLSMDLQASAGIFQGVGLGGAVLETPRRSVLLAARISGFYEITGGTLHAVAWTKTDEQSLPSEAGYAVSVLYFYPRSGFGAAIRLDAGASVVSKHLVIGVSVLGFPGFVYQRGIEQTPAAISAFESADIVLRPIFVGNVAGELPIRFAGTVLLAAADLRMGADVAQIRLGVSLLGDRTNLRLGVMYGGEHALTGSFGFRIRRTFFETGVRVMFIGSGEAPMVGLNLSVGR